MSARRILLLDHPTRLSSHLADALRTDGFEVEATDEPRVALELLRSEGCDVALGDSALGGEDLLREALSLPDGPPVILLDDFGSACEAVEAIRRGAFDVLARPVSDEQILLCVRRALEQHSLTRENRDLKRDLARRFEFGNLKSRDPRMLRVFETLAAVADSRANLLLQGESGTGKTMLARAVHLRSSRADGPFVAVHCGALPESLLESELFGHKKGSFTGAVRDRVGKFEAADGGTLFLDEIATASPDLQVKLLQAIEERTFQRVGDEETRSVDVRLIAAANQDLEAEVEAGRFRADLYYRIHVVAVEIPPLRDRTADVPLLAEHFLARYAAEHQRPVEAVDPAALEALCAQPWPGNVRELENTIERAVLLSHGPILTARDLGLRGENRPNGAAAPAGDWDALPLGPLKRALEIPERALILRALELHGGSRQKTAVTLGINRTTLFNKMRKYDLLEYPAGPRQDPDELPGDAPC